MNYGNPMESRFSDSIMGIFGGDDRSVAKQVEMFADMGITDIWLPPCSQSVAPQVTLGHQLLDV